MITAAVRLWGEMAPERRKEALTQGSFAWAEPKKKKKPPEGVCSKQRENLYNSCAE